METRSVFQIDLELRQEGDATTLRGRFPYGVEATMSDRGRVRKERFHPRAFRFAIDDPDREINLLRGHSFDAPLASKRNGSLVLEDTEEGVSFVARLPAEAEQPSYMRDVVAMVRNGLVGGISPGFRVPPRSVVPGAETLEPEAGNPGVMVRVIRDAVLAELSLVTRPAYPETDVDLRSWDRAGRSRHGGLVGWL